MTQMTLKTNICSLTEMANYPYELEIGSKKVLCLQCGRKSFKRVIETASGNRLPDHVGRCDHESGCGYSYTWKQYFADNPEARSTGNGHFRKGRKRRIPKPTSNNKNSVQSVSEGRCLNKKPEYLEIDHMLETLTGYAQNAFVQFLLTLFPYNPEDVFEAVEKYRIGTKDGFTVFPTISKNGKICKAKLIKFDVNTGKRIKDGYSISSLEAKLKKAGKLQSDFETNKDIFFGEHLLADFPDLPIAIVEAEKSAVIASICSGVFPDLVWLACGSGGWLKAERLKRIGHNRTILLIPDADTNGHWFNKWQAIASDARKSGLIVIVSDLIERRATDAEKAKGYDLADYLIREQARRNNPATREAFRDLIEERLGVMTFDGGMSEAEAESYLESSDFLQNAVQLVLESVQ